MAEIKIDDNTMYRAGIGIGYAFASFFRGVLQGIEDFEIEQAALDIQQERDAQEADEGLKRPKHKTEIGDCRKCWCDQCERIDVCNKMLEGALPDGIRPFPCVDCWDGMRFKPREEEKCEDFVQAGGYNNG